MSNTIDRSTPQRTLDGLRDAALAADGSRMFGFLTLEAQKALVGGLCLEAAYACQGDLDAGRVLARLLDRHGLNSSSARDWQSGALREVLDQLMAWSRHHLPEERRLEIGRQLADSQYSVPKIRGDRAHVTRTYQGRRSETRLCRIDGQWYVSAT